MTRRRPIPGEVREVLRTLRRRGFEAYLVGGAVRDLLAGRPPGDWDVATSARPGDVRRCFRKALPTGLRYGTVTVIRRGMPVQVTTYRTEGRYRNRRRPASVRFVASLFEDLSRRDFTVNALAYDPEARLVVDPFGGREDFRRGRLRTVGPAGERFREDALRIVRAARFIAQLGLRPVPVLTASARREARSVRLLSAERIRDELDKLLVSPRPDEGLRWLHRTGVLKVLLPELAGTVGVRQGGWHVHDVFIHTLEAVKAAPADNRAVRWALLLHDVAKPLTRTRDGRGHHYHGHEKLGAEIAERVLRRLRQPKALVERVGTLILHHLFEARSAAASDAAVRRFLKRVGNAHADDLLTLRRADARACGPGRSDEAAVSRLKRRIDRVRRAGEAFTLRSLAADGRDVMAWLRIGPGPEVGRILSLLLEEVLTDAGRNRRPYLKMRTIELHRA